MATERDEAANWMNRMLRERAGAGRLEVEAKTSQKDGTINDLIRRGALRNSWTVDAFGGSGDADA